MTEADGYSMFVWNEAEADLSVEEGRVNETETWKASWKCSKWGWSYD